MKPNWRAKYSMKPIDVARELGGPFERQQQQQPLSSCDWVLACVRPRVLCGQSSCAAAKRLLVLQENKMTLERGKGRCMNIAYASLELAVVVAAAAMTIWRPPSDIERSNIHCRTVQANSTDPADNVRRSSTSAQNHSGTVMSAWLGFRPLWCWQPEPC